MLKFYVGSRYEKNVELSHKTWVESSTRESAEWFEHDYLCYGDYAGAGLVGEANIDHIEEEFAELEGIVWHRATGPYGYVTLRFPVEILTSEEPNIVEFREKVFDQLQKYPLLNEDKQVFLVN